MPTLILLRHSTKDGPDGASLGPCGFELARDTGAALRGNRFSRFFVSSMWRTTETLAAMAEGSQSFDLVYNPPISPLHAISERDARTLRLWAGPCHEAEIRGDDMLHAAARAEPDLVSELAKAGAGATLEMVRGMADDETALYIGHSPMIEIAVRGLGVRVERQLQPCEGIRLVIRQNEVLESEELRTLPRSSSMHRRHGAVDGSGTALAA